MGVIAVLLTIIVGIGLMVLFAFAVVTGRGGLRKIVAVGAFAWCLLYVVALLGFSASSTTKTIAINEPKAFCGFYLDCHLHAVVTGVRTSKSIGTLTADGEFRIVTLKVFSDARNPSIAMRMLEPSARVSDASGRIYDRRTEAEKLLPTAAVSLNQDVKTNEPFEKEIVFDLPENSDAPRLDISEGYGIDKFIEALLIDDEDSLGHKRELFSLDVAVQTTGARQQ